MQKFRKKRSRGIYVRVIKDGPAFKIYLSSELCRTINMKPYVEFWYDDEHLVLALKDEKTEDTFSVGKPAVGDFRIVCCTSLVKHLKIPLGKYQVELNDDTITFRYRC